MSEGGYRGKPAPPGQTAGAESAQGDFVPQKGSIGDPMSGVRAQREQAAAQIARTLKVWRKVGDEETEGNGSSETSQRDEKGAHSVGDSASGEDGLGEATSEENGDKDATVGQESAPEIGAELSGVGRKVFLATKDKSEPTYTKKQCQTCVKILEQFDRLAQKYNLQLGEKRLKELTAKRDAGTITGYDLPATLRDKYDLPLDLPLANIRDLEKQSK